MVGVGHLCPMRSAGSAFSLLPLRSVCRHYGQSILGKHLSSFYSWIIMMDVIYWYVSLYWWLACDRWCYLFCRIILYFIVACLISLCICCNMFWEWHPYYDSIDDLIGGLRCYAWGMARAHNGLMMLLMVGRNHTLSCILWWMGIFYDDFYIFICGWMYHVWWMVSFTLLYLYHGLDEDDVFYFHICIFF